MFKNDPEIAEVLSGKSKRLAPLIKLVFKNGGLLNMVFNKKFKGRTDIVYGERPNQTAISYTADKSLYLSEENGVPHHALIEAGTGTGKSFAELVPFSLKVAIENQHATSPEEKKRVLIVTHTTTLQSQLYNEDIPDVQEVLSMIDLSFKATLLKGKGNYVCAKRMMKLMQHPEKLTDNDKKELLIIKKENCDANGNLTSGDKSAFPNNSDEFWAKINGNQESDCSDCPFKGKNCYYHAIKDSAKDADIMIGNHALLLNDLVQKWKTGQGTIPDYHYLAIDEAHHVEQMLVDYFSSNISSTDLKNIERKIYWICKQEIKEERKKEILATYNLFKKEVEKVFDFFRRVSKGKSMAWDHVTVPSDSNFNQTATQLMFKLAELQMRIEDTKISRKIDTTNKSIANFRDNLHDFAFHEKVDDLFYWIDNDVSGVISLKASPLDANKIMKEVLFSKIPVTCMSATIKLGDNLNLFGEKIGDLQPHEFEQLCVKSPFDYEKNAVFYVPKYAVDATDTEIYDDYCMDEMKRLVDLAQGRSFLLFTSNATMKMYRDKLAPYFESKGYPCLMQGDEDRSILIEKFKKHKNAVLFGGDSFWEGVDIKTRILSMVIMQKIPFSVPNPLMDAKSALVKAAGRNAFTECAVFPAIIKFKQGFGRLIRGEKDGGVVALLDGRVVKAKNSYGKYFFCEIPEGTKRTTEFNDLIPYIQ